MAGLAGGVASTQPDPTARRRGVGVLVLGGLAWSAALIHLQAAADHFSEYAPYAVCFVALAALQIAWGATIYWRASPGWMLAGVVGNLAVVVVWVLSRTSGLPFGPDLHAPETVGVLDAIATTDEVMLCVLALVALVRVGPRGQLALHTTGVLMILFSSLVLGGGLHAR